MRAWIRGGINGQDKVEDYRWIQTISHILSAASFLKMSLVADITTTVTFYDENGKELHELQVFPLRVKLDGVDYMVERIPSVSLAQLIKFKLPAPDLYQELLDAARSGLWLHVVGTEEVFDGGSWIVTLEAPDKKRFAVVLLNERRAEREGVAVAPFDLDRPSFVHGLSRTAEAELKVALVASLAKYQSMTATATPSDGDLNSAVIREALSSSDLTAPSRVRLKEIPPLNNTDSFESLINATKTAFSDGDIEWAFKHASELLLQAPAHEKAWNYGNAIYTGNMILGRIALREGRLDDAKNFLLESGKTRGSPQLNSFGPNMSLASDLLQNGEKDTVLAYFKECRVFWKMGGDKLTQWTDDVESGRIPNFGANLAY